MKPGEREYWPVLVVLAVVPWLCVGIARRLGLRLLPPQRFRAVPWGWTDAALLLFGSELVLPQVVAALWVLASPMLAKDPRLPLVVTAQAGAITVLLLPLIMVWSGKGLPYQMGLHCGRLGQNALLGVISYFLVTPLVAIAYVLAALWYQPTPHKIETIFSSQPTLENLAISLFTAVVVAPFQEELLFRGVLQPLLRRTWGVWPAIVGSSLLFAALHVDAWPAPIPLFVLALFLGYLAHRTASLVGPIVLHGIFNGVSMLVLVVKVFGGS